MRKAKIERSTAETSIELDLTIDGTGNATIRSGVGFLDHMLLLLTKHGLFDLAVTCNGDLEVDQHHSVEDIGIADPRAQTMALEACQIYERLAESGLVYSTTTSAGIRSRIEWMPDSSQSLTLCLT